MDPQEKLKLLKALYLLDQIPEEKLATLAGFLSPRAFKKGAVVFEEGSKGDSLYFVSTGSVRVRKRIEGDQGAEGFKDLAILGPGDCFGEMALIDESAPRSARAQAAEDAIIFELGRGELKGWLQSNPTLALGFFAELVGVLSKRLRRSSNELALLFDLSQWLLEPIAGGRELLQKVLRHMVPHLEGRWAAGAYLYNVFNDELDLVASEGDFAPVAAAVRAPVPSALKTGWLDAATLLVVLPGKKHVGGYLLLRAAGKLANEDKTEASRTLGTAAGLVASALENIEFRTEDSLRDRLKTSSQRYGTGI